MEESTAPSVELGRCGRRSVFNGRFLNLLECKGTIVKFYVKVVSLATCHLPSVIGHDPT